jgi:hypothetical protein
VKDMNVYIKPLVDELLKLWEDVMIPSQFFFLKPLTISIVYDVQVAY